MEAKGKPEPHIIVYFNLRMRDLSYQRRDMPDEKNQDKKKCVLFLVTDRDTFH